ncbi:MAG: hypothetical protein ACREQN_08815 [Candidatus Binataceae bacterium]
MLSEERDGLRNIRRLRLWSWFFVVGYVPGIWLIRRFTHDQIALTPFVLIWVGGFVACASRAAFSRCPRCNNYFHSTRGTPSFWNLLTRKCTECGLRLRADRVIYPSLE